MDANYGGEVKKMKGVEFQAKKVSFSKRKDCIMKKTRELSILCDVKAFTIVFTPHDGRLETWPENLNEVQQVINAYKDYSFKKENELVSVGGDIKKWKVGDNNTAYDNFIVLEKKQKLGSVTEMELLGEELKKIDSTLERVTNRIRILKKQKGHAYGYGSSSCYEDFAAARAEDKSLLQIEDFDDLNIFTLKELEMIQESGWGTNRLWSDRSLG